MKYLENKYLNIAAILIISILCTIFFHASDVLDNVGMSAIIFNWLPIIIGFVTLICYLIFWMFLKKIAWIITLVGVSFNLVITLNTVLNS